MGTRADAERGMITALAGSAALRELGLSDSGGEPDEQLAGTIALAFTAYDAVRMFDDCRPAAKSLWRGPPTSTCSCRSRLTSRTCPP